MICKKVLDMDYSKIEDIETQNKLDNAKTYIYNSNTGIPALMGHLSAVMSGIVQICLGFALAAPVLFVNSAAVTDIHSFLMSGWGAAVLLIFCGALEIFQAAALNPQAEKYMDQMYTDPKILQAERERSFKAERKDIRIGLWFRRIGWSHESDGSRFSWLIRYGTETDRNRLA